MKPTAPRPKGPLVLSVSLGLLTSFSLFLYLQQLQVDKSQEELVQMVVAAKTVKAETRLGPSDVTIQQIPRKLFPQNAFQSTDQVIGRLNKFDLFPQDPLFEGKLYPKDSEGGLSFNIPAGKRAVTVAVNEVIGVAGFIKPASRVDVIGAMESEGKKTAKVVLQNIPVLAVAQEREDSDHRKAKLVTSVTLAVSPQESEVLTLASEKGEIRLALRSSEDNATVHTSGVSWQAPRPKADVPKPTPLRVGPNPVPPPREAAPPPRPTGIEVIRGTERETAGG